MAQAQADVPPEPHWPRVLQVALQSADVRATGQCYENNASNLSIHIKR